MKCLAYLLVLLAALGVGCAYDSNQGPGKLAGSQEPDAIVKTKGNYEVAAYCFSRAYRDAGCRETTQKDNLFCDSLPQVEVAPDQDFGEFYKANDFNIVFTDTGDGNSKGKLYLQKMPSESIPGTSLYTNERVTVLLTKTERCQIKDSSSDEQKDDDTASESSS